MSRLVFIRDGSLTIENGDDWIGKTFPAHTKVFTMKEFLSLLCAGLTESEKRSLLPENTDTVQYPTSDMLSRLVSHGSRCSCDICQKDAR